MQNSYVNGKKKVILVTYLREKNFGDILLYLTVKQKLEKAGFETEIAEVYRTADLINKANRSDFLYFVGGGLIERSAPDIIKLFDLLYKHIRVPYGIVSLSAGEFKYDEFNSALRIFADNAAFFYTRDCETVAIFKDAAARCLPVKGVDIVFSNPMLAQLKCSGNHTGANFRDVPYPDLTGDLDWKSWSRVLKRIGVDLLVRDSSNAQTALAIPITETDEFTALRRCKYVVAMRYHVVLAAAMMGVLPIPISYCPKVRRLAKQLSIEEYCLGQSEHQKLDETFDKLKRNEASVLKTIKGRVERMVYKSNEIIQQTIDKMRAS